MRIALLIGAACTVLGVALTAISGHSSFSVGGTLTLKSTTGGVTTTGESCVGTGGYSDIAPGAEVVIADGSGKTLALGSLLGSQLADPQTCIFTFTVKHVPTGKKFYQVEVTHRGFVQYTEAQLKAGPALTLGS